MKKQVMQPDATALKAAAQAVLDRWNSPVWEWAKQGPTADLMHALRVAIAQPVHPAPIPPNSGELKVQQEADKGVFSMFNACMYKEQCRAAIAQPTPAEYAQGYTEGFNDACKPAQPDTTKATP